MPLVDDYPTDDIVVITGFRIQGIYREGKSKQDQPA